MSSAVWIALGAVAISLFVVFAAQAQKNKSGGGD